MRTTRRVGALLLLVATFATSIGATASADEGEPLVSAVGGGAAGIVSTTTRWHSPIERMLFPGQAGVELTISEPRVELPDEGHPGLSASVVDQTIANVRAEVVSVETHGNLYGTPFAQSTATITGLTLPGTDITGVEVTCTWDEANGARGQTRLVRAGGKVVYPPGGSKYNVPGLGKLTLNEKSTRTDFRTGREVITVKGIVIDLSDDQLDAGVETELIIGWAACDPIRLPRISGLQVLGT